VAEPWLKPYIDLQGRTLVEAVYWSKHRT